ncbi:MAG: acetyl-CoA acyltransferase [Mycobacterium sp.]|jgi:acetyl-CoA acetyltransferase|nr:acetyl-CoA acyltransferase [Mycobacterium sp.]
MTTALKNRVFVVGVGMTKFEKPGRREGWDYPQMAKESGTKALEDAGIEYGAVQQGFVGYCSGDSTSGQRALYELGMTGIPIVNVNNNCSTGSTALYLAAQSIRGGLADCVIALGFEKMQPGSLGGGAEDRESPLGKHVKALAEIDEFAFPVAPWMFGAAGREHMKKYGTAAEHFAKIGYKNHKHSVVVSEKFVDDHGLASQAVECKPPNRFTTSRDSAPRTARSSSCTTASRPTNSCTKHLACAARAKRPS